MNQIVTDPNLLKKLNQKVLADKHNIQDGQIVTDSKLLKKLNQEEEKEPEEKSSFYTKYITGDARTQYKNLPEIGAVDILKPDGTPDNTKAALLGVGLSITPSYDAQIDIIKKIVPGTIASKDIYDNVVITFPQDAGGATSYLNKPGASQQDLLQGISQTLQYIPGYGFVQRKVTGGLLKKGLAYGTAGALTSGVQDLAAGQLGSEQGIEGGKMAIAGGAGIIGEPLGKFLTRFALNPVKNVIEKTTDKILPGKFATSQFNIFSGTGKYLNSKGEVTKETLEIASKAGVNPELVDKKIMIQFAQALEDGIEPALAKEVVGANQFGISLWKAQALNDKQALKTIQHMREGAFGQEGIEVIAKQDAIQADQALRFLTTFRNKLIQRKKAQPFETPLGARASEDDAMMQLTNMIKDLEAKQARIVSQKYAAIDYDGSFKPPVMKKFVRNIKNVLESPETGIGAIPDSSFAPTANRALGQLTKFASKYKMKGKKLTHLTVKALETERKRLNNFISTTKDPTDRRALMIIKGEYDTFYNGILEKALATGDDSLLNAIKGARLSQKTYSDLFDPKSILKKGGKIKDEGGIFIQNVLKGDYTPAQVANWVYGNASLGKSFTDKSLQTIKRLEKIFPKGSEGYDVLRDGAFQRLINNSFRRYGDREIFSPGLFVKVVDDAINGKGRAVSKQIFTETEKKELLEFSKVLNKTLTPEILKNPSKTAASLVNILQSGFRALLGIGAFQAGGIQMMLATRFGYDAVAKRSIQEGYKKKLIDAIDIKAVPNYIGLTGEIVRETEQRPFFQGKRDLDSTQEVFELLGIK
jgi:hypothetical protein